MIVHFSFKGAKLDVLWPPPADKTLKATPPEYSVRKMLAIVKPHAIAPHDRVYLSHFYDALAHVMADDGRKKVPQITTMDGFAELHNSSLGTAIDRDHVGIYPNLMEHVWEVIFNLVGVLEVNLDGEARAHLATACSALAWRFAIHEG